MTAYEYAANSPSISPFVSVAATSAAVPQPVVMHRSLAGTGEMIHR
jgi:hypothetical protein